VKHLHNYPHSFTFLHRRGIHLKAPTSEKLLNASEFSEQHIADGTDIKFERTTDAAALLFAPAHSIVALFECNFSVASQRLTIGLCSQGSVVKLNKICHVKTMQRTCRTISLMLGNDCSCQANQCQRLAIRNWNSVMPVFVHVHLKTPLPQLRFFGTQMPQQVVTNRSNVIEYSARQIRLLFRSNAQGFVAVLSSCFGISAQLLCKVVSIAGNSKLGSRICH